MESNGGMKDLSRQIYYHDPAAPAGQKFKRYRDMEKHLDEVENRNLELKAQLEKVRRAAGSLKALVNIRFYADHHNMGIESEPEFRALCRAAGIEDEYGDPTKLDYDLRRELENSNRETGTTPF